MIVEDGPTITHGGMPHGAGHAAVSQLPDVTLVDPRDSAAPEIAAVYERYPHIGTVLPAIGYSERQLDALRATINASNAQVVVAATPIDLAALGGFERPVVRARYEFADAGEPRLWPLVERFVDTHGEVIDAPLLTIALGGNALSPPGGDQSYTAERAMVRTTALALVHPDADGIPAAHRARQRTAGGPSAAR